MLLVRGDYVWTGDELHADAAILCDGDKIRSIGPWSELRAAHPDAKVIGGEGIAVLPGLVNAHHHGNGITSFLRGVHDDCLEPWLAALRTAPSADPYLDTLGAALDIVAGGYTTVALFQSTLDPSRAGEEARARIQACRDVGLRVALGLDLSQQHAYVYGPDPEGLPPKKRLSTAEYIALLNQLREAYADDPYVSIFAAPSGPQWVTDEAWEAIGAWSREHRVPLHTHCVESFYEAEYARREYEGGSAVTYLDRRGALHEHTCLVHGVYLTRDELDLMATRRASLITNPGSNLRLKCGVSPVLAALERGVNVALGTDGCTLGDRDDAFAEMRLLFYLQRVPGMDTPALTWQQAIRAATQGAAWVTPWEDGVLGTLAPGAFADMSLFDLRRATGPWSHPDLHPVHLLVHRASRAHLAASVVGGKLVWQAEKGSLLIDSAEAEERLADHMNSRPLKSGPDYTHIVRSFYRAWDAEAAALE